MWYLGGGVQLADTSAWQLETDDLTELDVVGIDAGDPVRFTLDAIPAWKKPVKLPESGRWVRTSTVM